MKFKLLALVFPLLKACVAGVEADVNAFAGALHLEPEKKVDHGVGGSLKVIGGWQLSKAGVLGFGFGAAQRNSGVCKHALHGAHLSMNLLLPIGKHYTSLALDVSDFYNPECYNAYIPEGTEASPRYLSLGKIAVGITNLEKNESAIFYKLELFAESGQLDKRILTDSFGLQVSMVGLEFFAPGSPQWSFFSMLLGTLSLIPLK